MCETFDSENSRISIQKVLTQKRGSIAIHFINEVSVTEI